MNKALRNMIIAASVIITTALLVLQVEVPRQITTSYERNGVWVYINAESLGTHLSVQNLHSYRYEVRTICSEQFRPSLPYSDIPDEKRYQFDGVLFTRIDKLDNNPEFSIYHRRKETASDWKLVLKFRIIQAENNEFFIQPLERIWVR